jgi:oligopeptide transport system substrate-binding protein
MAKPMSRRDFLRVAGISAIATAAVACQPKTVIVEKEKEKIVTQVVKVEKEVTKIVAGTPVVEKVVETKVVEKVVTSTPAPALVTAHGRQLPDDAAPLEKQVHLTTGGENKHLDVPRDIYSANQVLNWSTEPLLRRNEMMELVPALADSYTPGPSAEYFDFSLRKGARWDDGEPITADDWVFTYEHLSDPNLDTPWVWYYYDIRGIRRHKMGEIGPEEIGVEKIDDYTLRIYGEGKSAPHLPALLAYQAACPVPIHLAKDDPEHWADEADGFLSCGPYSLVKWEHNKYMVWEPNEYYNGPHKPGVQRVVSYIGAAETFNMWLSKEIDFAPLNLSDLKFMRRDPELNKLLTWFNNFQVEYLSLNTLEPPMDDLTLRQALSHAIDRDALVDVLGGTIQPGYTLLSPGFPGYNAELAKIQAFDLELAKQLLAEAGYPDGKDASGKQLELTFTHSIVDSKMEFVQAQWQENLGIKVNYEIVEDAQWGKLRSERAMQIYKGPYEYDYMDPANFLRLFRSVDELGSPRHPWKNDEFDELFDRGQNTAEDKKRFDLYSQAERILIEDVGAIFLSHNIIFQAWWPFLTGIPYDITGRKTFRWLDLTRFQMYIRDDVDEWRPKGWLEKADKLFE